MDYLYFKKNYPESCKLFFKWLSEQDDKTYENSSWYFNFFQDFFVWESPNFCIHKVNDVDQLKEIFNKNYSLKDNRLFFDVIYSNHYEHLFKALNILIDKNLI